MKDKDSVAQIIAMINYGHIESISLTLARKLTDEIAGLRARPICPWCNPPKDSGYAPCPFHGGAESAYEFLDSDVAKAALFERERALLRERDIAALTADLAARGETIKGLEQDKARLIRQQSEFDDPLVNELTALRAQLIEERWQKNRAEFERDHHSSNVMSWACVLCYGKSVDPRHAYTPDDWRRDAREQLINEGVIKT